LATNAGINKTIILIINFFIMSKLLKLSNVNLNYTIDSKSINILKNISFEVDYKETISVVGESGSGKTSLIMLIGGLEKVSSGNIFFRDLEVSKMNEDEISEIRRKNIGIVFQSFYLIPNYTALENVSLSLEINKFDKPTVKAKEILDRFGLSNRFNNFPSQLSGGEQQRVAIARSVAMKPELILADEPTGNLDSENTDKISSLLFNYIKDENASLIMVTHDNNLANLTKRKIIIKDGEITENE
jgi:putative ABC transport system ATP-binding protein